jgi:D-3-phosphoglycerate dehydrogenase
MIRILASDGIEKQAAAALEKLGCEVVQQFYEPDELNKQVKEFDALVVRSATKVRQPAIDAALETGRLKIVIRGGVGIDNIDAPYAREKGIEVRNTPNASSASVAEIAIGHMFCLARHIHKANVTMREGKWEKKNYDGIELAGKTLGLIGMGRIAKCTANMAKALGMNVIYTNRSGHRPENEPFSYVTLDELLAKSDFISLHIPHADKPVISASEIAKMKDGVYIINTARGGMVVESDLLDALDSGKVSGAGIDVFAEEPTKNERLYTHPNISMTPHTGAQTAEAQTRIGAEIVSIIQEKFNL